MKKNYFMLAAATMMFAACAETDLVNEITVEETQQAIGFETFAQKATRAESTAENSGAAYTANDLSNHHSDFLVWASKNVTSGYVAVYPGNDPGTVRHTTTWTADPLKYWDKTATDYQFYAAAPAIESTTNPAYGWVANNTVSNNGYLTFNNFVLKGEAKDNLASVTSEHNSWKDLILTSDDGSVTQQPNDIDLMIAAPCKVENTSYNKTGSNTPDAVNLDFIHILSRLNINVKAATTKKTDNSGTTYSPNIKLTALDVFGLKNKGSFTEKNITTTTNEVTNETTTTNEVTNETTTTIVDFENLSAGTHHRWLNTTQGSESPSSDGSQYKLSAYLGGTDNGPLQLESNAVATHKYLIIPQTVANSSNSKNVAEAPSGEVYLQIKYTVDGEEYETYYSLAAAFGIAEGSSLAFNEGWQNTLTITISPDEIKFTGDVAAWADNTKKDDQTID